MSKRCAWGHPKATCRRIDLLQSAFGFRVQRLEEVHLDVLRLFGAHSVDPIHILLEAGGVGVNPSRNNLAADLPHLTDVAVVTRPGLQRKGWIEMVLARRLHKLAPVLKIVHNHEHRRSSLELSCSSARVDLVPVLAAYQD